MYVQVALLPVNIAQQRKLSLQWSQYCINIHLEILLHRVVSEPKRCNPELIFFDWCINRYIFPNSLFICLAENQQRND